MIGCHKIINSSKKDDYIIATGKTVSLENVLKFAFSKVNVNWRNFVYINKNLYRPFEINENYANTKKLIKNIKWKPENDYKKVIEKLINYND